MRLHEREDIIKSRSQVTEHLEEFLAIGKLPKIGDYFEFTNEPNRVMTHNVDYIRCEECGCKVRKDEWNTRTQQPPAVGDVEALKWDVLEAAKEQSEVMRCDIIESVSLEKKVRLK